MSVLMNILLACHDKFYREMTDDKTLSIFYRPIGFTFTKTISVSFLFNLFCLYAVHTCQMVKEDKGEYM